MSFIASIAKMICQKKNDENKMPLIKYIEKHYSGNQAAFARAQGVARQQVTQWINAEFVVLNDRLYSPRRELISRP